MMRIEDAAGNVTYTIPYCDCGLAGGCDKCQPNRPYRWSHKFEAIEYIPPEDHTSDFMDEGLRRFYEKKGYI